MADRYNEEIKKMYEEEKRFTIAKLDIYAMNV
jgi:hypothetical protein